MQGAILLALCLQAAAQWKRKGHGPEDPEGQANGHVAVVGGDSRLYIQGWTENNWDNGTSSIWIFDPVSESFDYVADDPKPPSRYESAGWWNSNTSRLSIHGGWTHTPFMLYGDAWQWGRLSGWSEIQSNAPTLTGHAVAVDEENARLLSFGGRLLTFNGLWSDRLDQMWECDLVTHRWTQKLRGEPWPSPRHRALAGFDAKSKTFLVFGGMKDSALTWRWDLWSFDTRTNAWAELSMKGAPPYRGCYAGVFDKTSARLYLHGGCGEGLADLWYYDVAEQTWTELVSTGSPALRHHKASFDPEANRLFLTGGNDNKATYWLDISKIVDPTTSKAPSDDADSGNPLEPLKRLLTPLNLALLALVCVGCGVGAARGRGAVEDSVAASLAARQPEQGMMVSMPPPGGPTSAHGGAPWMESPPFPGMAAAAGQGGAPFMNSPPFPGMAPAPFSVGTTPQQQQVFMPGGW